MLFLRELRRGGFASAIRQTRLPSDLGERDQLWDAIGQLGKVITPAIAIALEPHDAIRSSPHDSFGSGETCERTGRSGWFTNPLLDRMAASRGPYQRDGYSRALHAILEKEGRPETEGFRCWCRQTGTHSIAALFEGSDLKVEHEPDPAELIELALDRATNAGSSDDFRRLLRASLERHDLDVDVSQINGYLIEDVYAIFPNAKYILTVRDANGWVGSLLNHFVTRECESGSAWDKFRRLRFDRGLPFHAQESWLEEHLLFSLDSYLEYWEEHTLKVLSTVPEEKLCVVPTLQIGSYKKVIYRFIGLKQQPKNANDHAYKGSYQDAKTRLLASYVNDRCSFYSDRLTRSARQIVSPSTLEILKSALYPDAPILHSNAHAALVRQLMIDRSTDVSRWAQVARETDERWDGRAKQAAALLRDQDSVLDLGCGAMTLERFLPSDVRYIPSDCIKRDDRTIVVDLNTSRLPDVDATCIVVLGVFEYIHDVPALVTSIAAQFMTMVCSYIPLESVPSISDRRATGWVNDLSLPCFEDILAQAGFSKLSRRKYLDRTYIWRAERA